MLNSPKPLISIQIVPLLIKQFDLLTSSISFYLQILKMTNKIIFKRDGMKRLILFCYINSCSSLYHSLQFTHCILRNMTTNTRSIWSIRFFINLSLFPNDHFITKSTFAGEITTSGKCAGKSARKKYLKATSRESARDRNGCGGNGEEAI